MRLGKRVTILTDECNEDVVLACAAASGLPVGSDSLQVNEHTHTRKTFGSDF